MLYPILRTITRLGLTGYYRKIYVHLEEPIPKDRPVILAGNHPNAFTEPLLMACFMDRILHFITRSDVFHPALKWFFRGTHQIPIYRFVDKRGYKNLKNNQDTFATCYKVLSENGAILIFSEGSTQLGKSVRPLQKGTARMGFGLVDAYPDVNPLIVPVGFTYSRPNHWNGDVMINVGRGIEVKDYMKEDEHINVRIQRINEAIKTQLDYLAINIEEENQVNFQEGIANIRREQADGSLWTYQNNADPFRQEKKWTEKVNAQNVPKQLKEDWEDYKLKLDAKGISKHDYASGHLNLGHIIYLIVAAPIALVGLVLTLIPFLGASWIVRNKVKTLIFSSGIKIGVGTFASLIMAIGVTIVLMIMLGWSYMIAFPFIVTSMLMGIKWFSIFKSVTSKMRIKNDFNIIKNYE